MKKAKTFRFLSMLMCVALLVSAFSGFSASANSYVYTDYNYTIDGQEVDFDDIIYVTRARFTGRYFNHTNSTVTAELMGNSFVGKEDNTNRRFIAVYGAVMRSNYGTNCALKTTSYVTAQALTSGEVDILEANLSTAKPTNTTSYICQIELSKVSSEQLQTRGIIHLETVDNHTYDNPGVKTNFI